MSDPKQPTTILDAYDKELHSLSKHVHELATNWTLENWKGSVRHKVKVIDNLVTEMDKLSNVCQGNGREDLGFDTNNGYIVCSLDFGVDVGIPFCWFWSV